MRYVDLMHSVPVRPVLNMPQLPGTQAPMVAALGRLIERGFFQLLVRKEPLEVLDDTLCAVEAARRAVHFADFFTECCWTAKFSVEFSWISCKTIIDNCRKSVYFTEIAELIRELNSDVLNIQISDSVQKKWFRVGDVQNNTR